MSRSDAELKELVEAAAGIVAGSLKRVGISQAMDLVGFNVEERRKMTLYQKVRRRALRLTVVDKKSATPVPEVVEVLARVDTELFVAVAVDPCQRCW
jgi:hypothetical protein